MSASGRFGREITVEEIQYREEEGIVRPIWSFSGDGTYDEKIETLHNGEVINTVYGNGTATIYPFDPIDIPIAEVSQGDSYTIRATPGKGISEDFFEPRTAIDEGEILEVSGSFSLPRTMRTDYDPSASMLATFTYSVPGEFINRTGWHIDLADVTYDYETESATLTLDTYWEEDGGRVEGLIWLALSANGTVVRSYEESAGGSSETINWENVDGQYETEWTLQAQPGDPIVVNMWGRESEIAEEIIDDPDNDAPGVYEGRIVARVPPDSRRADVDLLNCAYVEDTVTVGRVAQQYLTIRNNTKLETEVELTYSGAGIDKTVTRTIAPEATDNYEVRLTPTITGEYDLTPEIYAERTDE